MPAALATSCIEGFYCYIYNHLDQADEWCARRGRRGARRPTRHSTDDHEITHHEITDSLSRYHANESPQDPMACDASNTSTDKGASSDTRNGEPMHVVHDEVRLTQGAPSAPFPMWQPLHHLSLHCTEVHDSAHESSNDDEAALGASTRARPTRLRNVVMYGVDLPQLARVPGVDKFYISENLPRSDFSSERIDEVVTVGDTPDLQYTQWPGRVDFRFPDGELDERALVTVQAATQHCIEQLHKGKAVAVHCAAGVNRSSLVAVLVMLHQNPTQSPHDAIRSLTSAKFSVNPSWLTLTNRHFRAHLLAHPTTPVPGTPKMDCNPHDASSKCTSADKGASSGKATAKLKQVDTREAVGGEECAGGSIERHSCEDHDHATASHLEQVPPRQLRSRRNASAFHPRPVPPLMVRVT